MKAFIEILREKYGLAQPEAEKLLEQMELLTYRKGEHIVREGERNSSFYLVADGIWRGHYLRDGVDISLWFAFQGDSIFSSWGICGRTSFSGFHRSHERQPCLSYF
jgi:signal-transduction protein with cAMP-binding, CBS, and nucleotidyltransferase domain